MRWSILVLLAGCEASIGGDQQNTIVDSSTNAPVDGDDGAGDIDAPVAPPSDAPMGCNNGRVVYLNFDGVTLVRAPSDATTNAASWIGRTDNRQSGTVKPYRSGDPNRLQQITTIVTNVKAALSQFPVTVVTTRPMTGPYVMVAYGGINTDLGTPYTIATSELDCGDLRKSDVAWVSDTTIDAKVDDYTLGAIGFGLGLTATSTTTDCMCGWDNDCRQSNAEQCTLSAVPITRDPAAKQVCPGLTTQNEVATFDTAFCQ